MNLPADVRPRSRNDQQWVEGWGRWGVAAQEVLSEDLERVGRPAHLFRGLGRSYGDSALPAPGDLSLVTTTLADRILGFTDDGV
ncbi:MAG: hypothetical protein KGO50_01180, partial [Myxococcales bacterium]|nr:hypothetical protein [Myxococcales bacterium]